MYRFTTRLLISGLLLLASPFPIAWASPQEESAASDPASSLRSVSKTLSDLMAAKAAALRGGDGRADEDESAETAQRAIEYAQTSFSRIAGKAELGKSEVEGFAYALYRLAKEAPDAYNSLLSDQAIRARLFDVEKRFKVQIFASAQSKARALALADEVLTLGANGTFPEDPESSGEQAGNFFRSRMSGLKSKKEFNASMERLRAALRKSDDIPVPRFDAVITLAQAVQFLHPRLVTEAKPTGGILAMNLMRFAASERPWSAYRLFLHFATLEQVDEKLATEMGESFIQSSCETSASSEFDYPCLTTLSLLRLHYGTLLDPIKSRSSELRIVAKIKASARLRQVFSRTTPGKKGTDTSDDSDAAENQAFIELAAFIPRWDQMSDMDLAGAWALMNELQATAYWVVKAGKGNPQRLFQLVSSRSRMGSEFEPIMVVGMAAIRAVSLKERPTALAAIGMLRTELERMAKDEGIGEVRQMVQLRVRLDILELAVWVTDRNLVQSRLLAQKIRARIEPILKSQGEPVNRKPGLPTCVKPVADDDTVVVNDSDLEFFKDIQLGLAQLQMQWDVKSGKTVPLPMIYSVVTNDIEELFKPRRERAFSWSGNDDDKGGKKALTPAEFLAAWSSYRTAFSQHAAERRSTAKLIKCLLSRPEMETQLAIDFVGKGSAERAELGKALYELIDDSGTLLRGGSEIADDDFRLLQILSVLQAQSGISAAAARSVFPNEEVREKVRQSEIGMTMLKDRLESIAGLSSIFELMSKRGDLFSMLDIALAYPDQFKSYSELKQQSIAAFQEVKDSLGEDEAAVVFASAGKKTLAVVIRRGKGTLVPLDVPVETLRASGAQLLASLRFPPKSSGKTLPAAFRADLAWTVYDKIFRPLEPALAGASTVYLIAGEFLSGIPFQALLNKPPPPQSKIDFASYRKLSWLGDQYAFVTLPSAHALLRAAKAREQDGHARLFGVGAPAIEVSALQLMQLEGIPDTARLLQRTRNRGDPQPLLGEHANNAELTAAARGGVSTGADIVLINSHTLPAGEGERFGTKDVAIVLAPSTKDGFLRADLLAPTKVMELQLPARFVMLLACETAGGRSADHPQPFAGLVNSFFFSGADTVLATVQPVNSAVTEDLAVRFLHHVRGEKMSGAKALQRAAAEIRCPENSGPCAAEEKFVRAHPAYWSQFMLVGSGR